MINNVTVLIESLNMKGLNVKYRKTELMSTQLEIDIILNIWFTCIRLKLSWTIHPCILIKSKIGGKIVSQKHAKTSFYRQFLVY